MLDLLIKISGVKVAIERDPQLVRPTDEKTLLGDNSKLKSLGWEPIIPFETTLKDIFANWMQRLQE